MKSRKHIILFLPALMLMLWACARNPGYVEPTGWESVSPAADSLTRAIELSFQDGAGTDSTLSLMREYRKSAMTPGNSKEAECRLLYWQGRIEIRGGNRTLGHALYDSAYNVATGATKEYLGRILEWRRENREDFTDGEWYGRKLAQAEYFERRKDSQMLYNVYRELMELMRDVGLHDRALHYLALITECNLRIDSGMARLDDKMNRAAILSDMGRDSEAVSLLRELRSDSGYMREPVNLQLVNMNICNLTGDTAALHAAYRSIVRDGDRAELLPKVWFYLADEALTLNDCGAASSWSDSLASALPYLGPGTLRVKSLKGIARCKEMCGGDIAAKEAYKEYALAADSLADLLSSDNVANLELSRAIAETDRRIEAEREKAKIRISVIIGIAMLLILAGASLLYRKLMKLKKMRNETMKMRDETEHRRMALQLDADRRGIASEIGSDDFMNLFAQKYPLFISRLREMSPRISDTALRLAGYIAIGLSTKEISDLMNVRPESVRQAKWRLRKTLGLESDEDLFPLLSSLLHQ